MCAVRCTERVAVFLNCIRQGLGSNVAGAPTILTGVCYGFPQSPQANTKTVPQIRPRPLPSTSFLIHYLLSSSTSMLCSRVASYTSFGRRGLGGNLRESRVFTHHSQRTVATLLAAGMNAASALFLRHVELMLVAEFANALIQWKTRFYYLMASYFCSSNNSRLVSVSYVCHFFRSVLKHIHGQRRVRVNYMNIILYGQLGLAVGRVM